MEANRKEDPQRAFSRKDDIVTLKEAKEKIIELFEKHDVHIPYLPEKPDFSKDIEIVRKCRRNDFAKELRLHRERQRVLNEMAQSFLSAFHERLRIKRFLAERMTS